MKTFLFMNLFLLVYLYGGYYYLLRAFCLLRRLLSAGKSASQEPAASELPGVSVFIAAYNEEDVIEKRLANILEQDYPPAKMEIVVVSDGSTDSTNARVQDFAHRHPEVPLHFIAFPHNQGKAMAQNAGIAKASREIIVNTDADNLFAPGCLKALVQPFADPRVGVVGGIIVYRQDPSAIAQSLHLYRSMEHNIRACEAELGIMVKTDGPCTAFRREIWEPINDFEDVDSVITLLARRRGLLTVQADEAICYDSPNRTWRQEFKQRSRMTRKNLFAIFNRWQPQYWRAFPGFTFALFSHKILRYFSPFFLLGAGLSFVVLCWRQGVLPLVVLGGGLTFLGIWALAWYLGRTQSISTWLGRLGSFLLANLGFAWGVLGWLAGNRQGRFSPTRAIR